MTVTATAAETPRFAAEKGLGALASFWYYRQTNMDSLVRSKFGGIKVPILADSGAFSAHTKGAQVDIGEYAEWLHRWKHLFFAYVNLDVIYDHEATRKNQLYLESRGLSPLPVYHARSPFSALEEMTEGRSYVGIGGVALMRASNYMPWLVRVHRYLREKGVTAHGFGATSWPVMSLLPSWQSCDSTSWQAGQRYGSLLLYTQERGMFQARRPRLHTFEKDIRRLGFTLPQAVQATRGDHVLASRIAAAAAAAAQARVRALHRPDFVLYLAGLL